MVYTKGRERNLRDRVIREGERERERVLADGWREK